MDKTPLLRSLTSALRRHYLVALSTFASVIGGSIIYLMVTPPVYESSTRLMVDPKEVSVSDLGRALNDLESNSAVSPLATQAELIMSEHVLRKALLKVFPGEEQLEEMGTPSPREIGSGLDVRIIPATNILELTLQYTEPELTAKILDAVVESAVEDNIEVIRAKASTVREFLEASIPEQQARLKQAEAAENIYRQENGIVSLQEQTSNLIDSLTSVENEERILYAQLRESTERIDLLQQVTGVEQLNNAYEAIRIGQDRELNDLRSRLTALEAAIIEGRSRLGDQHPELLALLDQRDSLTQLYAEKVSPSAPLDSQTGLSGGPASNELSQDLIAQFITGEIENQALQQRLSAVQRDRDQLESRLAEIPRLQQPLATLSRERQEAEEALRLLLSKLEEARIAEAQLINNIRVLGNAEIPIEAAAPSPPAVLVIAIVTGLIFASGVVLLLEAMDNTLRDADEAKTILQLPILGTLPKLPPGTLVSECQPGSSVTEYLERFLDNPMLIEPYHSLLQVLESLTAKETPNGYGGSSANIEFQWDESSQFSRQSKAKIIVVSSPFMGEGKSAVVAHLAAVQAMLSRKTLLIDANFSQPLQHDFFDIPAYPGLSDVVSGNNLLTESIQPTSIENLSVLTHGLFHERPSILPEKASMRMLLDEAASLYDWIIIEASPVTLASDAATFSQYTDGLLMVVRPNFMPREKMRQIIERFQQRGTSILGAVLNETQTPWDEDNSYAAAEYQLLPWKALRTVGNATRPANQPYASRNQN
ncbi:MAG: polysaccharide biosynthesis tyrosine autokinase [Cyanobacteria bacterium P01_F01_bin.13]